MASPIFTRALAIETRNYRLAQDEIESKLKADKIIERLTLSHIVYNEFMRQIKEHPENTSFEVEVLVEPTSNITQKVEAKILAAAKQKYLPLFPDCKIVSAHGKDGYFYVCLRINLFE